ncbi:WD40-repeat-containing domain protein [Phycomyces blakesleeanus]|uniref:WD40-repeat-containing domain protein n=1 Tax=Phycomyces blakesleeanus TaxID=4837 RepID=A0ABR3AZM7_PHYBL
MIEVFDVQRPGQESQKIPTTPKRRSKKGQKGIISCLDFSPDYAGLYAAGSYSKTVGIYDETNNEMCLKLSGIEGGVTQVKFSPNGNVLFTASRQADSIMCWDIRNTTNVLYELNRPGKTNQRISFDINSTGKVLITGDKNGNALFYDCLTGEERDEDSKQRLQRSMHAHDDITTSASFNPVYPVIATTSGQRKFTVGSDEDQDLTIDNSIKIWKTHGQYEWHPTV